MLRPFRPVSIPDGRMLTRFIARKILFIEFTLLVGLNMLRSFRPVSTVMGVFGTEGPGSNPRCVQAVLVPDGPGMASCRASVLTSAEGNGGGGQRRRRASAAEGIGRNHQRLPSLQQHPRP